jgi:hypothetical protein
VPNKKKPAASNSRLPKILWISLKNTVYFFNGSTNYPAQSSLRAETFVYSVYVEEFWQPYRVLFNKTRAL